MYVSALITLNVCILLFFFCLFIQSAFIYVNVRVTHLCVAFFFFVGVECGLSKEKEVSTVNLLFARVHFCREFGVERRITSLFVINVSVYWSYIRHGGYRNVQFLYAI